MRRYLLFPLVCALVLIFAVNRPLDVTAEVAPDFRSSILDMPMMKPTDSQLRVAVGDKAPDFDLPAVQGGREGRVRLADYLGRKNVVLTFIPAAWTPVCSGQWPGYHIARELFEVHDAVLIGLSVDNAPTLHAWVAQMGGVWFPVASDFWPHGGLAQKLGILRSEGVSERALFLIDKAGVIRFIDVHDINTRPELGALVQAMQAVSLEK
jgi:alkyl hydroperoxide reductase subunit AhpC